MKHLLNGVAIAAALAVAGPVWAQTTMTPSTPPAAAPATPPKAMTPPAAAPAAPTKAMTPPAPGAGPAMASPGTPKHRPMHHMAMHRHWYHGDSITEQLNREELARIQGGGAPPPPPAPGAGAPPPPPKY
jgi:hypothetical protein